MPELAKDDEALPKSCTWVKHSGRTDELPGWFPASIMMVDTGEIFIAKSMEEIPPERTFKVLAVKVKEEKYVCQHEGWSFKTHGRVCHQCGTFMVDFGD